MSRVYPSIQGFPFRKIVSRVFDRGYWKESLSCGHTFDTADGFGAKKRRCYTCKRESEQKTKKAKK